MLLLVALQYCGSTEYSVRSLSPYLCILPNLGFVARCTFLQCTSALKPQQNFAKVFCISFFFFSCLNYSSFLFLFTSVKRQRHFCMAANAYMCCQFLCYLCFQTYNFQLLRFCTLKKTLPSTGLLILHWAALKNMH